MVLVGWLFLQRQQKNTLRIAMEIVVSIVSWGIKLMKVFYDSWKLGMLVGGSLRGWMDLSILLVTLLACFSWKKCEVVETCISAYFPKVDRTFLQKRIGVEIVSILFPGFYFGFATALLASLLLYVFQFPSKFLCSHGG
jgi:hypothetical protein